MIKPLVPSLNWNHPLTKGLVLCVPLFEPGGTTVIDLVSKLSYVTQSGTPTHVNDVVGMVLKLNGSSAYLRSSFSPPSQFSIFSLVNPTGLSGVQTIMGTNASGGIQFRLNNASLELLKTSTLSLGTSAGSVAANSWSSVGVTYDGTNGVFYINGLNAGTLNTTQTFSSGLPAIGQRVFLGNAEYFTGKIAFLSVWNRVLSPVEAKSLNIDPWQIYNRPLTQPFNALASLAQYYSFLPTLGAM